MHFLKQIHSFYGIKISTKEMLGMLEKENVFIGLNEDELVAFCTLDKNEIFVCVKPAFRRQGIAKKMLKLCKKKSKEKLIAKVPTRMRYGQKFFMYNKFRETGEVSYDKVFLIEK